MATKDLTTSTDNTFDFSVGPFKYTFKFNDNDGALEIRCQHVHEFHLWTRTIKLLDRVSNDCKLGYTLNPKQIYKILSDYNKIITNDYIKISVQDNFIQPNDPIRITITLYSVFDKELFDTYELMILSYFISPKEKNEAKLEYQKDARFKKIENNLESLNNTIEILIERLDVLVKRSVNSIQGPFRDPTYLDSIEPINKFND